MASDQMVASTEHNPFLNDNRDIFIKTLRRLISHGVLLGT